MHYNGTVGDSVTALLTNPNRMSINISIEKLFNRRDD